ncbi:MAG TPA: hypothetical protein VK557_12650 [Pyrinomonadaceae bacterium]|nr:hypothetical protein [Pyrinomonadaceae bacterium]
MPANFISTMNKKSPDLYADIRSSSEIDSELRVEADDGPNG